MTFQRPAIFGGGNIGARMAIRLARNGLPVRIHETPEGTARSKGIVLRELDGGVMRGKLTQARRDETVKRIFWVDNPADAVAEGVDLVIEAVFEDRKVKEGTLAVIRENLTDGVPVVSVTSAMPIREMRYDAGFHPMTPPHINNGLEIIRHENTPDGLVERLRDFALAMGWVPFVMDERQPGFVVNGVFVPYMLLACDLLADGTTYTIPTIEEAGRRATGFKMGPFQLMNITGVPITAHAAEPMKRLGDWVFIPNRLGVQITAGTDWSLVGDPNEDQIPGLVDMFRGMIFANTLRVADDIEGGLYQASRAIRVCLAWPKGPAEMMVEQDLDRVKQLVELYRNSRPSFPAIEVPEDIEAAAEPNDLVVEYYEGGEVATVSFNRPEAMNALSESVITQLSACIDGLEDRGCRVCVLTGFGRAFVAGADISGMVEMNGAVCQVYTVNGTSLLSQIEGSDIFFIAAVNGFALGGGLELALVCDYILAADRAQFGFPEIRIGVIPGFDGIPRSLQRLGRTRLATVLFNPDRRFNAQEAFELGLVNEVVLNTSVLERARDFARYLSSKPPLALQAAKRAMFECLDSCYWSGAACEEIVRIQRRLFDSEDKRTGMRAQLDGTIDEAVFVGK